MSVKSLEDNTPFYDASEEGLKGELAKKTAENTWLREFFDSMRAQRVDFRERLAAKAAVARLVVQDSRAMLRLYLRYIVQNFRAGLIKLVREAFSNCSTEM